MDAPGITMVARPPGRAGGGQFSGRYGQSTAVVLFDRVFVPWGGFLAGEWDYAGPWSMTYGPSSPHLHRRRAGFGDLLIGAGALMTEANGIDLGRADNLRDSMVEPSRSSGFYACGVAASVYGNFDAAAGVMVPEAVFANIGKLLLATQIYDMQRLAHHVSAVSSSPCRGRTKTTTRPPPDGFPRCWRPARHPL